MITVITELGDRIILTPALVAQGDAAVEAYIVKQRKMLKLPAKPLHGETDRATIAGLLAQRIATPAEAPAAPAPAIPDVAEEA